MKASNPQVMVHAYRLLMRTFRETNRNYPIHLGVTEAGDGEGGCGARGGGTLPVVHGAAPRECHPDDVGLVKSLAYRGEQQVLGRDGRAILRGGTQQLLQPAALRVVLHAITRLRDHLLLSVAVERRLGVEAATTLDGAHERRHGAGHGRSHGFSVFVERFCAVETVCRDRAEHTICRSAKRSKVNQPNACGRLQVPRDPAISRALSNGRTVGGV